MLNRLNDSMKKLLALAAILIASPALAGPPFKYQTECLLENNGQVQNDICTVVETRENNGALRTRNIFSNRFGLTIKSRFDKNNEFVTWDSHNKFEYKFEYRAINLDESGTYTYVMPGFLLQSVSWD